MNMKTTMLLVSLYVAMGSSYARAADTPEAIEFFEKRIRPILATHCYECHSMQSKKRKGGLWLDTRDSLMKGGESGPALVPGDPDRSLLIRAVRHVDKDLQMPPKMKLTDGQIADLAAWVKMGAPDPAQDDDRKGPRADEIRHEYRGRPQVLVVSAGQAGAGAEGEERSLGPDTRGSFHSGAVGVGRRRPGSAGRSAYLAAARHI